MFRTMLTFVAAFSFIAISNADPIKKTTTVDSDKLIKECAEAFVKATLEGKGEDAVNKFCTTPFLGPDGMVLESLDKFKKVFSQPPPANVEVKVTETIILDKFNEFAKKKGAKELNADQLKQIGEFLGKDGRIVMLEVKEGGQVRDKDDPPYLIIRVKDGKAQIVGVGGR